MPYSQRLPPQCRQKTEKIMFGLGTGELVVILLIVVLVFGASRLPQLGKGLGEGMRSFKDALRGNSKDNSKQIEK